jgi:hypothetical protein
MGCARLAAGRLSSDDMHRLLLLLLRRARACAAAAAAGLLQPYAGRLAGLAAAACGLGVQQRGSGLALCRCLLLAVHSPLGATWQRCANTTARRVAGKRCACVCVCVSEASNTHM